MKLSAPTKPVFIIAVILAVLSALGFFGVITPIVAQSFYLLLIAFVLLAAACLFKGI